MIYKYLITVRGQKPIEQNGNNPMVAFNEVYPNTELEETEDAFNANVCIALMNGKKKSVHYYFVKGKTNKTTKVKNSKQTEQQKKTKTNDSVFTLESVDLNQVTIAVHADDALTVAKHPYLDSKMAYITVTRGEDHIFTIIYNNGKTFSFDFGSRGHTLISDNLTRLKHKAIKFLESNNIYIDYKGGNPYDVYITYNSSSGHYGLRVNVIGGSSFNIYSDTAKNEKEMIQEIKNVVTAKKWEKTPSAHEKNVYYWQAVDFKLHLR